MQRQLLVSKSVRKFFSQDMHLFDLNTRERTRTRCTIPSNMRSVFKVKSAKCLSLNRLLFTQRSDDWSITVPSLLIQRPLQVESQTNRVFDFCLRIEYWNAMQSPKQPTFGRVRRTQQNLECLRGLNW